jgi:hypothetical protein
MKVQKDSDKSNNTQTEIKHLKAIILPNIIPQGVLHNCGHHIFDRRISWI